MNEYQKTDLGLLDYVPEIEKPKYRLGIGWKFFHTFLLSFIYSILIRIKIIGAKSLKPVNYRFSLMATYEGSIISVGKSVLLWASILGKILIHNKVIDLGRFGQRKEHKNYDKLVRGISIVFILITAITKTREIFVTPLDWLVYNRRILSMVSIYLQYVIGGFTLLLLDEIQNNYGVNNIKYHLFIDSGYSFWTWFKHFKTLELESGFNPYFTISFSLLVTLLTMIMFRSKKQIKLEYTGITHNYYDLEVPFMLGDSNTLFILSTFKEGVYRTLNLIQHTQIIRLSYYLAPLYTFLKLNEPFYYYTMNKNYNYVCCEVVYISFIFFFINYLWLILTNMSGPQMLIKQISNAKLKMIGTRAGHCQLERNLGPILYKIYYLDCIKLYGLVLLSNIFSLIGRSNNTSFLIFIISIMQLWDEIKVLVPEHSFVLRSRLIRLIEYI